MGLTQCPDCDRRCFTDATSCTKCFLTFKPGLLQANAEAEEKSFSVKTNALFLSLFLIWLALSVFFQLRGYLGATGI